MDHDDMFRFRPGLSRGSGRKFAMAWVTLAAWPTLAWASESAHHELDLPWWTTLPFAAMLLSIALLPLFAPHFWHENRNRLLVAVVWAAPVAGYLWWINEAYHGLPLQKLYHSVEEYLSFILLLTSLYVVAGGLLVEGNPRPGPAANTAILALGGVLANLIGTTGASMVLIRPILRMNSGRLRAGHVPLFFIFLVSNTGGLLTPLGDPPLFLGFLNGVDFFWTLRLWKEWLVINGSLLVIFFLWDSLAFIGDPSRKESSSSPIRLKGQINLLLLGGILAAVLLQSPTVGHSFDLLIGIDLTIHKPWGEIIMAGIALASLLLTPNATRAANGFTWAPILEVAILFSGIFVTMVPALAWLGAHGPHFGISSPWQYFWLTGSLSAFLDNAPTYLTFATLAAKGNKVGYLMLHQPELLKAVSCGAVLMGSLTYIGNGPNFMVKAIADEAGYKTPSFFGYFLYSSFVLLPLFGLLTWLSFSTP